jgi:hypothetical protein
VGCTQPLFEVILGALSRKVKWPQPDLDLSAHSIDEGKNEWISSIKSSTGHDRIKLELVALHLIQLKICPFTEYLFLVAITDILIGRFIHRQVSIPEVVASIIQTKNCICTCVLF